MGFQVQPGYTLSTIAAQLGVSVQDLLAANPSLANAPGDPPAQPLGVPGWAGQSSFEPASTPEGSRFRRAFESVMGRIIAALHHHHPMGAPITSSSMSDLTAGVDSGQAPVSAAPPAELLAGPKAWGRNDHGSFDELLALTPPAPRWPRALRPLFERLLRAPAGSYVVLPADTLQSIAEQVAVSPVDLAQSNGISDPAGIHVGDILAIPQTTVPAPPSPTPTPSPQPSPAPAPAPTPTPAPAPQVTYTVKSGDTLSAIGQRFGVSYQAIAAANHLTNPNLIYPGQVLIIPVATPAPAPAPQVTYTVKAGDTLSAIGQRFGVSYQAIAAANHLANPNLIYPGEVLVIPGATSGGGTPQPPSGGGPLFGADTSMWQSDATFNDSVNGKPWTAIKATEGVGWTDPTFRARWDELGRKIDRGQLKLRIAYAFLHAGDGAGQAAYFLNTLGIHGALPAGTRLALDWEGDAVSDPAGLRAAASHIHSVTGTWPLIYCSASKMGTAQAYVPSAPIWEARWGAGIPSDHLFVQYSDGPGYDHDVFNGDVAALDRFAGWA